MPEKVKKNEENIEVKEVGKIKFEKIIRSAKIHSPLDSYKLVEQKIEFRKDPLTNHYSRINKLRADRVKQATMPNENYEQNLQSVIENSSKKCFFCPENVEKSTPRFPKELGLGDRIKQGTFTLFPNLFVFSQYHAVGTLGDQHFTPLQDFSPEIWQDAIEGSIKYFKAVNKFDESVKYPSINFNYLPPSASSIIHPHIQIIQDVKPTKYCEILMGRSKQYTKNGSNYWLDLIEAEKEINERFITENNFMAWIATYSPLGKNELTGIVKIPKTDITVFTKEESAELARGISQALKALYIGRGATSVNMAIYIGPINEDHSDSFQINLKIVTRPNLMPNYTGDIGFMELLHFEPIAAATPEDIVESVRGSFNR